jgi:hypothetical protein
MEEIELQSKIFKIFYRKYCAIYTRRVARQYGICWLKKELSGTWYTSYRKMKFSASVGFRI